MNKPKRVRARTHTKREIEREREVRLNSFIRDNGIGI